MPHRSLIISILFGIAILAGMLCIDRDVALAFGAMKQSAPLLISFFSTVTALGKSQWYLYPFGLLCLTSGLMLRWKFQPQRRTLWLTLLQTSGFIFANIALSGLAVDFIKIIIGRPRPVLLLEQDIFNQFTAFSLTSRWWSFPSGHSATILSLALAIGSIWPRWRWPLLLVAGTVAASRVIVTAHYPSDMLGGLFIAAMIFTYLERFFHLRGWACWNKNTR
jgi:membrane-associated phospholipid phosphatase